MSPQLRPAVRAWLLGAAAALALAAGHPAAAPAAAQTVRLGYIGISSDAGIFIALDKGYFKEQGIDLSLERFGLGADQMALLGSGQLDIASGAVSPTMFNAIARGLPIAVVADKGSFRKGFGFNVLVVRKALVDGGQFKTLADLRGRTMAVPGPGSILNFEDYLVLKKGGLTPGDVRVEYIDLADQPAAMANGRLDAAIMVEPFATASEQRGIGKIVMPLDELLPEFQTSVIYYNTAWARAHPGPAGGWMVAYVKALRYYNTSLRSRQIRDDVIATMSAHTPIKDRAVWDKMIWPGLNPDGTATARTLLDYQRWLINEHQISQFLAPGKFLDTSYTENATRVLGAWQP